MPSLETPGWIRVWFLVSSLVVYWDATYCLFRPHSMEGGSLNFLWSPYNLYATVDYVYGLPALHARDGWTSAQASLNLVESTVNLLYLYLASQPAQYNPGKVQLLGFSSVLLTLNKTILYLLNEVFSGMKHTGHNDLQTFIVLWVIPNGLWILVPSMIAIQFGRQLCQRLAQAADKKSS
ncbi:hypothetical protein DM01DRAFT_1294125 [Hesseltinella vesiculosa]|uniref:EXPERA domain-containing protein n=1 Tax=Hesseltinella vesiculosa TaxID=101127 RepID=A0A1X2G647_9FUNG|nr:hypothetical protein DM01DRAFT_1294125 [Hesseltinella vesiculosa]